MGGRFENGRLELKGLWVSSRALVGTWGYVLSFVFVTYGNSY